MMADKEDQTVLTTQEFKEVDWNDVKWEKSSADHSLSIEEKDILWKRLQKEPQFRVLPQVFKDLIESGKEGYSIDSGSPDTFKFDKEGSGTFFSSGMLGIHFKIQNGLTVIIYDLKNMRFVDEPQETEAVDPKTKRYYVLPSKNTIRSLTGDDLAYVKAFTETVNRNIHYLGSSQVPYLDPQKLKRGDYIGMTIWPLTLVQPKTMYEASATRDQRRVKKEINKTHAQLVDYFAKGDEQLYDLQDRLGTPLYHPRVFAPAGRRHLKYDCFGHPMGTILGVNAVHLSQARQSTDPDRVLGFAYERYFKEIEKSCALLRSGMEGELSALDKKSMRYRAVAEVIKQANKYLTQIEKTAKKCIEQSATIYKKPPYAMLDPKGTYLKAFWAEQKKLREAREKQNKETSGSTSAVAFPRFSHAA